MVEQFQSFDAMQDQVKHQQYHYHKVYEGDELVGYIGSAESARSFYSCLNCI